MINTAPNHKHTYDEQGRMTCCTLEEKIYTEAGAEQLLHKKKTIDSGQDKVQLQAHSSVWKQYLPAIISFVMLLIGIALDNYFKPSFFTNYVRLAWYAIAYLPVGLPVIKEGWEASLKKEFFTEFTLMVLATMGAFAIGQYPEGVAVMLFYAVGELFQKAAVNKAKNNIKALLDVRPSSASVLRNNKYEEIKPEEVEIGETIQIKAGEKIPLDGEMLSAAASIPQHLQEKANQNLFIKEHRYWQVC